MFKLFVFKINSGKLFHRGGPANEIAFCPNDCKNYNKKGKKMIDAVNVVDIVYQRYWGNKIRVCQVLSKTSGNPISYET